MSSPLRHAEVLAAPFDESARLSALEQRLRETQERLNEAHRRLEQLPRTDALTGLGNRRFFSERLRQEWELSRRLGHSVAVLLIEIDQLTAVIDQSGPAAGHLVLRHLARLLEHSTRASDTCVRYGEEEFALILPATTQNQAEHVAKVLREEIAVAPCGHQRITVSIGVAAGLARDSDDTTGRLVERAAAALDLARAGGRDRVECAPDCLP